MAEELEKKVNDTRENNERPANDNNRANSRDGKGGRREGRRDRERTPKREDDGLDKRMVSVRRVTKVDAHSDSPHLLLLATTKAVWEWALARQTKCQSPLTKQQLLQKKP